MSNKKENIFIYDRVVCRKCNYYQDFSWPRQYDKNDLWVCPKCKGRNSNE